MKIIEIDITNACIHSCSNCTRLCGHHSKPYFMDFETFKRAVDSLDGFEGGIGMMGGEPTLHPEFERFAQYLNSKYPEPKKNNYFLKPTAHFMRDRKLEERHLTYTHDSSGGLVQRIKGPVLFSSLASNYHRYYELIQDVFRYQGINDHKGECLHQPILVTRKDMGIPDAEWEKLRDNCWMQNVWSASITPKGCFFCEVAGVLDMLFDGPGGWPIEKGWWKRKPEDFKDQLHWCELCGVALNTKSRDANEGIDDASKTMYDRLKAMNTPKFRKGLVSLYTKDDIDRVQDGDNHKFQYHSDNMNRLAADNNRIYPSGFNGILIGEPEDTPEMLAGCIRENRAQFDRIIIFGSNTQTEALKACFTEDAGVELRNKEESLGECLNRAKAVTGELAYNIILSSGTRLADSFKETLCRYAVNPGSVHYLGEKLTPGSRCRIVKLKTENDYFILYNPYAYALRKIGYDGVKGKNDISAFIAAWEERKRIIFSDEMLTGVQPVNALSYEKDCRYFIYGTGTYGERTYQELQALHAEIIGFIDSDVRKQGKDLHGLRIIGPDALKTRNGEYDKVVIAALAYAEIRETLLSLGLTDDAIVAPIY